MLLTHNGRSPRVDPSATVAPTAVVCGDVEIGPDSHVGFGAALIAEGSPIRTGRQVIIRDNCVIRSTRTHDVTIGDYVLVGPHVTLFGCRIGNEVFLATGSTVFHGAQVGDRSEIRVNGIVHLRTVLAAGTTVPIGWVAVGDPAAILPTIEQEQIWAIQEPLDFPRTAYGLERQPDGGVDMKEVTRRLGNASERHREDQEIA